jgi:hypothetical protein
MQLVFQLEVLNIYQMHLSQVFHLSTWLKTGEAV